MAYMVMQRYTTAIREAYAGRPDVAAKHRERAAATRAWLESLEIPAALRAELVEPMRAIEDAFADLERAPSVYRRA